MRKKAINLKLIFILSLFLFACQKNSEKEPQAGKVSADSQKMLRVIYCDYTSHNQSEDCIMLADAQKLFDKLPASEGNFMSVVFNNRQSIQFISVKGRWLAEITNDSVPEVFNQLYITKPDGLEMIREAYIGDVNKLKGFTPVSIMKETLDDVRGETVLEDTLK